MEIKGEMYEPVLESIWQVF